MRQSGLVRLDGLASRMQGVMVLEMPTREFLVMPACMQRILRLRHGSGSVDVAVDISWPEQRADSWFADWAIHWPDRERRGSAGGSDAIQALLVALNLVGAELNCSAEHAAGRLSWADGWSGYGFPVPNGMRDALTGDDAKYL